MGETSGASGNRPIVNQASTRRLMSRRIATDRPRRQGGYFRSSERTGDDNLLRRDGDLEAVLASNQVCLLLVVGFEVSALQCVCGSASKLTVIALVVQRRNRRFERHPF